MECFNWKKLRDIVIVFVVILFAAYASFKWIVGGDIRPNHYTYQHHLKMDTIQMKALKDTLYLHQMMDKADSIANVTKTISDRYQDDVNLMIYKATQWFTIWLGIMAIVAGGMAINQFYNHRKAAADRKELAEKFEVYMKTTTDGVDKRIKDYQGIVKEYVEILVKDKTSEISLLNEKLAGLNKDLKDTYRDIKISSLVTCISTFPDPSMFTSKPEKKEYLRYYLSNLHNEFKDFVSKYKETEISLNELSRLAVVLTSVKYVLVRSRSIFPGYHQNITYNQLCKAIDKPLKNIVNGDMENDDLNKNLTAIVDVFGKMIRDICVEGAG
jgi:hypothetical protein